MIRAFLPCAVALSLLALGCSDSYPLVAGKANVTVGDRRYILDTGDHGTKVVNNDYDPWAVMCWNDWETHMQLTETSLKGFHHFSITMKPKNKPGGYFATLIIRTDDEIFRGSCPYLLRLEEVEELYYGRILLTNCDIKQTVDYARGETGVLEEEEKKVLHIEYAFFEFQNSH